MLLTFRPRYKVLKGFSSPNPVKKVKKKPVLPRKKIFKIMTKETKSVPDFGDDEIVSIMLKLLHEDD
jgi:hypothetical protein